MKIIEVRDGFIKFEADNDIFLSSLVLAKDEEKGYIAQVNQLKIINGINIATAKILFLYINNMLQNYDKIALGRNVILQRFDFSILAETIKYMQPVIIGKTLDNLINITIDADAFNKKMLLSLDSKQFNNVLVKNFVKQFSNLSRRTVIIDTLGIIDAKKYSAGVDFKLPLNTSILKFMYGSCLNDVTPESKTAITEIFKELAEYSEEVPFVPFSALKNIVDEMVEKQHIFKLLVLKNKLAKFDKLGYFASTQAEYEKFNQLMNSECVVFDLSRLDTVFQNIYLSFIYENLKVYTDIQVLLEAANTISKRNLKNILSDSTVPTTFITHSKFQYLNDIKKMFDNFIIQPSPSNNMIFKVYSTFLTSMNANSYLITGEAVNYIPIVCTLKNIEDIIPYQEENNKLLQADGQGIDNNNEEQTDLLDVEIDDAPAVADIADATDMVNTTDITEIVGTTDIVEDADITNTANTVNTSDLCDINSGQFDNIKPQETIAEDDKAACSNLIGDEIINAIDERSNNAIDAIAQDIENVQTVELFSDEVESVGFDSESEVIMVEDELYSKPDNAITSESTDYIEQQENSQTDNIESEENNAEFEQAIDVLQNEVLIEEDHSEVNIITDISEPTDSEEDNTSLVINEENNDVFEVAGDNEEKLTINIENDIEELLSEPPLVEELNDLSDKSVLADEGTDLANDSPVLEESDEYSENNISISVGKPQIIPLSSDDSSDDLEELLELDVNEADENDIIIDLTEGEESIIIDDDAEQKIVEAVDKVYTTRTNTDEPEEFSDSDLDFIDSINTDEELLELKEEDENTAGENSGILEELQNEPITLQESNDEILEKRESNTPIVPVYDADIPEEDLVVSDPLEQGDAVVHAKYGNGIVEKMIKYGNKTLFSINFENVGRRLLDPALTEIKKV